MLRGFTWNATDHVMIEAEVFVDFVLRLLSATTGNPMLADQIRAVLGPSVVMLDRSGTTLHATTPEPNPSVALASIWSAERPDVRWPHGPLLPPVVVG
jgi:hypothetical protein